MSAESAQSLISVMSLPTAIVVLLVALLMASHASAVWIALKEGERRCFYEEVPGKFLISGSFESKPLMNAEQIGSSKNEVQGPMPPPPGGLAGVAEAAAQLSAATATFSAKEFGIKVEVFFPENVMIYSQEYAKSGRFTITSGDAGDYKICFSTTTTTWFNPLTFRFSFDIDTGADAVDYDRIAKKEHLNNLEVAVRRLLDRTNNIVSELNYQKERETAFRDTSESTNSRASYFSVLQLGIIAISSFVQMQYLKVFFKKKKLI